MGGDLRIVLADDWRERRVKVRRSLEEAGFLVLAEADTLRECYEHAVISPVDAVLSSPLLTERQEQEFLSLLAPVTPLFRPALVAVRDEYPRIIASFEYWSNTGTVPLPGKAAVVELLGKMAAQRRGTQSWSVTGRDVDCFLRCLGFKRDISGYAAAKYAITSMSDGFMAKELYADMAAHFGTSPVNVERSLRFAITKAVGSAGGRMWELVAPGDKSNLKVLTGMRAVLRRFMER